ncbi:AAA family ATPase [Microbispora catharanthi]|uniref:Nuclease SbcCD subunit C n=1 Tax=Microbispora catharanthi TaxID=1712871 RepID=A0A5N6BX14_9ACTN|nr:SMC family ATPase [Microbispora catharanthi]KAB8185034.1 AAA family ATPase [Microbispora catharanthi]
MRLHRLRLVAFGSFPGAEEVDFDALGEAGLFLIHGPTGAGKTTVLDAVCYALYGRVPGQRESARSLRCDHAPPDRGPSVTLELTIRGRRLRITRSPAWMRPKLRGSGLVEEKAKARIEELTEPGGQWIVRSTRSDEAGDFVNALTGMTAAQFCQVAMLPQGEFAKFLRAGGEERRELLERLFSVRVFGDMERWLADHRTRAWREAQELGQRVESVLDRMRGAAGDGLPLPEDADDPAVWAGEVLDLARGALADAVAARAASQEALLSARARLEEGRALADRQRRHAAALARRQELDAAADERSDLEAMLDEAARADRVAPLIRQAAQRAEAAAKARRVAADAVLRALPGGGPGRNGEPGVKRPGERAGAEWPEVTRPGDMWPEAESVVARPGPQGPDPERMDPERPDPERIDPERLAVLERERRDEVARVRQILPEEARLRQVRSERADAERGLAELTEEEAELTRRLAALPAERLDAEERLARARTAAASLPGLTAARDAALRLREVTGQAARLDAELARLAEDEVRALAAQAELPESLAGAEERLRGLRDMAARVPALEAAAHMAGERLEAARLRDALTADLERAEHDRRAAVDLAQERRDRLQEVRQARIDGMAAELAAALVAGAPCAVCGATEHPRPAAPAGRAATADDEQAAQEAFEAAQRAREEAETSVAALSSRLGDAAARAGDLSQEDASATLADAREELARLRAAETAVAAAEAEAGRLAAELESARERAAELTGLLTEIRTRRDALIAEGERLAAGLQGDLATAEADLERARSLAAAEEELTARAARLAAELEELGARAARTGAAFAEARAHRDRLEADERRLAEVIDGSRGEDLSLAARLDRLSEEADLLREAAEAAAEAAAADRESETALVETARAATGEGFASVEHAAAAVRTPEEREAMSERLGHLDAERATVEGLLADPELVAAAAEPAADLPELEAGHERTERDHTARTSARDRAKGRLDQLTGLAGELDAALRAYRPAEERHRLARRLAELATGTSGDNRWHMRLSAYVLGERLRQVVDAANERLDRMSSGRYLLRHDLNRSAGDRGRSGGGLGLRVLDAWTGVERDPATLSGGESFITSLALALGLADVVTAEAGGAEIGSLFVDEGFGTLDDETLDDVLDILDGLREGGRAVGVVSHVAELRVRIPAQLRVVKGRSGSTLSHR